MALQGVALRQEFIIAGRGIHAGDVTLRALVHGEVEPVFAGSEILGVKAHGAGDQPLGLLRGQGILGVDAARAPQIHGIEHAAPVGRESCDHSALALGGVGVGVDLVHELRALALRFPRMLLLQLAQRPGVLIHALAGDDAGIRTVEQAHFAVADVHELHDMLLRLYIAAWSGIKIRQRPPHRMV